MSCFASQIKIYVNLFLAFVSDAILKTENYLLKLMDIFTSEDIENISLCIFSILLSTVIFNETVY